MRSCILLALLHLLAPLPVVAQFEARSQLSPDVTVAEVDQLTLAQLARAEKFFIEKQYSDALETLRRTLDQPEQRLIPVAAKAAPQGFATYVPLREEIQRRLCTLAFTAPEALRLYRSQVDAEAATLLNQAKQQRSEPLLERLVNEYLASSVGDEAALLLGDAALARGDFVAARTAWLKIDSSLRTTDDDAREFGVYPALPWYLAVRGGEFSSDDAAFSAAASTAVLAAHPEPSVPLADVRARLIVASILEKNQRRAEWELALFRKQYRAAVGRLGSRTGNYVELLEQLLMQSRDWPSTTGDGDWPTFAGSVERNAIAAGDVEFADEARWSIDLPRIKSDRDLLGSGRQRVAEHHEGILSYHPIVLGDLVLIGTLESLRAYRIENGEVAWEVALRDGPAAPVLTNQQVGVPRITLSAGEGVVLATLPVGVVPAQRAPTVRREDHSRIVGVDVVTRKRVFEAVAGEATTIFEGTPIIDRGRVYVAVRRQAEIRPQLLVACYHLASGRRLWQQQVSSADSLGEGRHVEFGTCLLTLQHNTLYCNTNLGAIAALATNDGAIRWLLEYPRATFPAQKPERTDRHFFRSLNPCLLHEGQVICAPADCDRIFSLDATSGQLVWTLPPGDAADAIHLLGVGAGHLLASGDYLYWINVVTGQVVTQFPAALPIGPGLALPSPRGWGRGLLVGDRVLWPTQSTIHIFEQLPARTGMFHEPKLIKQVDLAPRNAAGGNLLISGTTAITATGDRLILFGKE